MTGDVSLRRWRWAPLHLGLLAALLGGCRPDGAQTDPGAGVDPAGYVAPPTLTRAAGLADGGASLFGRAPPGARVRLRAPEGAVFNDEANAAGDWSINLPPSDTPRMFAFDAEASGRDLHGEGAVLVLPSQEATAFLMRAGFGALPIGRGAGLQLSAVDADGGGGGAVSGFAPSNAAVRFLIDGQPVGGGQGDATGRFALLDLNARTPLSPGAHVLRVESKGEAVEAKVEVASPDPGASAFRATREGEVWRIDWRLPAGGAQTTFVFDPPRRAAP